MENKGRPSLQEAINRYNTTISQARAAGLIRKTMENNINHPSHYGGENPLEVINIIEHYKLGFNLGNVCKYILRAGKKDSSKIVDDLKKAVWYLNREIKNLEDGRQ